MRCKNCNNIMGIMIGGANICSCGYASVEGVTIAVATPNGRTIYTKLRDANGGLSE